MEEMQSLVQRVKKGDTDAFVALYKTVYQDMYAYACYMLRNPADAEDVVSETVVYAYENIGKLRDADKFRHWIFKILSNQCRKKRKSYLREGDSVEMEFSGSPDPMAQAEDKRDLEAAFTILSEEERYI
ncbi:MAG: RNA polymerase sigma factor, partial [Lachnospiraceae bacterium]|nr:RNA polymerase sigma factor [Lachnospiraceae bacterium]